MANDVGRPRKYATLEELDKKINEYFEMCDKKTEQLPSGKCKYKPYTLSGLCLYLDICPDTFCEYAKVPEFTETIKKARLKAENWVVEGILTGEVPANAGQFVLTNNFSKNWKNRQEVENTINLSLAEKLKQSQKRVDNE